jgi:chromate reductase
MKALGISGSLRSASYNTKLLHIALRMAREAGASMQEASWNDVPIYNEDLAPPSSVERLRSAIAGADLIVIASPEYNYSIPGGLKNAIDWVSRGKNPFDGKVVAIMGVSNGPFGTLRMQPELRHVMTALNALLLPQPQVMVRNGGEAFTQEGELADKALERQVKALVTKSLALAESLKNS